MDKFDEIQGFLSSFVETELDADFSEHFDIGVNVFFVIIVSQLDLSPLLQNMSVDHSDIEILAQYFFRLLIRLFDLFLGEFIQVQRSGVVILVVFLDIIA